MMAPTIDFSQIETLGNRLLSQLNALREVAPIFWNEPEQAWIISGHAEVLACFRGDVPVSAERFKLLMQILPDAADRENLIGNFMRYFVHFLVNLDPPAQTRLRKLMLPAFSRRVAENYRPVARKVIEDVLDDIEGRDRIEFVEDVARRITGINIMRIMGLEDEGEMLPKLQRWAYHSTSGTSGIPTREQLALTDAVFVEMAETFLPIVRQRRAEPKEDFVSLLVHARDGADQLSDDEIVGNLILILIAGHDTTLNTMALSVDCLSRDAEAVDHIRSHPDRILNSTLELMRFVAMSTQQGRVVAEDFEWNGHHLKKGQIVHVMTAAANRDPRVFSEPERLDLERPQAHNVTFGPGIHHCIGHFFAKMQLTEFFPIFLDRFEHFTVLDRELSFGSALTFRGPKFLNLALGPRRDRAAVSTPSMEQAAS